MSGAASRSDASSFAVISRLKPSVIRSGVLSQLGWIREAKTMVRKLSAKLAPLLGQALFPA
jgi:hypothetical protein